MPTVLRLRNIRVVIYPNDHPPAHVHAVRGDEARARFALSCPDGPVELMDQHGFRLADIRELGGAVAGALADACRLWSTLHG
jgi:hypothetical protein